MVEKSISAILLQRLKQLNVELFVDDSGDVRVFVPPAGSFGRPLPPTDYALGHEEGAIHELRMLLRSCPELRAALKEEVEGKPFNEADCEETAAKFGIRRLA